MIKVPVNETIFNLMTAEVEIDIDGKEHKITIHALNSPRMVKPLSEYKARLDYAKQNEIPLTETKEIDLGMGIKKEVESQTEWAVENTAILLSNCVTGFPEKLDLAQELIKNPEFAAFVDAETVRLNVEFTSKKKN